jgi:hypothetical protein
VTVLEEDEKWFAVSLRLWGDGLPLDEIESLLTLTPTRIGRVGESVPTKIRPGVDPDRVAKFRTNLWLWTSPSPSSMPFEEQITSLLGMLEPRRAAVEHILSIPGTSGELFLGFSSGNGQGGARFSSALLSRVGSLGLSILLDLYPPVADDVSLDDVGSNAEAG